MFRTRIGRIERIIFSKQALPQGNNIRENLYNPCSKRTLLVRRTLLKRTRIERIGRIIFSKQALPQGNNIRENPYNPCSKRTLLVKRTRIERIERITLLKQELHATRQ